MDTRAVLLWIAFLVTACNKHTIIRNIGDDQSLKNVYGTWKLVSREDHKSNTVFYKDQQAYDYCSDRRPCDVILKFSRINNTDSITGNTITNRIFGTFSFDGTLRTFKVIEFGGTQVADPRWSNNIWDYLYLTERFHVNRFYLRLFFDNGNQSLTFERQ